MGNKNPMILELVRATHDQEVLIAQYAAREIGGPCAQWLINVYPQDKFLLRPLKLRNDPRWLVIFHDGKKSNTIAQFEPEFKFIAEAFVLQLVHRMGPHFALQEYKPADIRISKNFVQPDGTVVRIGSDIIKH